MTKIDSRDSFYGMLLLTENDLTIFKTFERLTAFSVGTAISFLVAAIVAQYLSVFDFEIAAFILAFASTYSLFRLVGLKRQTTLSKLGIEQALAENPSAERIAWVDVDTVEVSSNTIIIRTRNRNYHIRVPSSQLDVVTKFMRSQLGSRLVDAESLGSRVTVMFLTLVSLAGILVFLGLVIPEVTTSE